MKILRILFLIILFNLSLLAKVTLYAPDSFTKGESLIFSLEAIGSSVKFPKIEKIEGYLVESLGTSRSIQITNGNYSEKLKQNYRLFPKSDITIPSFTFEINGIEEKTQAKKISSLKIEKTKSNYFDLSLKASKQNPYVGEDLIVKLIFKYKRALQITELGFEKPHFDGFWYKKLEGSSKQYEENGFVIQELDFLLFPQRNGILNITPLKVDVGVVDTSRSNNSFSFFSPTPKIIKVYSNELKFDVKTLPKDINLIGDFDINASVDKRKINQGESISYKINILGSGNFDDINDIKLNIKNAMVYDNKAKVLTNYEDGKYTGKYEKVYSIVPQENMIIPSLEFKYFDKVKNKIISKKTKSFKIEVKSAKVEKSILEKPSDIKEVKKTIIQKEISYKEKVLYFVYGFIFALLIIGLSWYVITFKTKRKKDETDLLKLVKKSNSKEQLLKTLVPYLKQDAFLDDLIYECDSEKEFKILKKEIINHLKITNI